MAQSIEMTTFVPEGKPNDGNRDKDYVDGPFKETSIAELFVHAALSCVGAILVAAVFSVLLGLGIVSLIPNSGMVSHYIPGSSEVINVSKFTCGEFTIAFQNLTGDLDLNASVYLLDNTSDLTLINTLNFTITQDGQNPIILAPSKWYYYLHYLNKLSVVTIDACLTKGTVPAEFYIIKGDANFSNWTESPKSSDSTVYHSTLYPCVKNDGNASTSTSGSGNWLDPPAEVQEDDLTLAEQIRYQVEKDDSYYLVFFSLIDKVTIEAQVHFMYYSYSSGSTDAVCSSRLSELVCHLKIPSGISNQSILFSTRSPNVLAYGSYTPVSWQCNQKGIPLLVLSVILPVMGKLFFVIPWCVYIFCSANKKCKNGVTISCLSLSVLVIVLAVWFSVVVVPLLEIEKNTDFHIADYKARATRLSTIDTNVCEGVHVSSSSPNINATVYLLDYQPELKGWSNFTLANTKLLSPNVHNVWNYYLHEGSTFTLQSACLFSSSSSAYFSIITENDYAAWINDGDQNGVVRTTAITSRTCDERGPLFNHTIATGENNQYLFVLYNNETSTTMSASLAMHFCRTEYTMDPSRNFASCHITADLQPSCLVTTPIKKINMRGLVVSTHNKPKKLSYVQTSAVSWKCRRRVGVWSAITAVTLVCVVAVYVSVHLCIWCVCKK